MRRHRQLAEGTQPDFVPVRATTAGHAWKLEDAKARFSEVVRRARNEGPQRITLRGKDAVVVISVEELERLQPAQERVPFVEFMEGLHVPSLELSRESDRGRNPKL
jgi:antitoxin Phd